jgi:hypothetical protein
MYAVSCNSHYRAQEEVDDYEDEYEEEADVEANRMRLMATSRLREIFKRGKEENISIPIPDPKDDVEWEGDKEGQRKKRWSKSKVITHDNDEEFDSIEEEKGNRGFVEEAKDKLSKAKSSELWSKTKEKERHKSIK